MELLCGPILPVYCNENCSNCAYAPKEFAVWADGTYCEPEEVEQMTHMSDDFSIKMLPSDEWGAPRL